jgi:uroporphyrinogen-III synthase
MKRVLSTKKLSLAQKELLLNSGLAFVEYEAISIELLPFQMPTHINNAIFTSQNAVHSYLNSKAENASVDRCYCVGKKTAALLAKNGENVVKIEENASILANFISKSFNNETFYFFSGNMRKDDISNIQNSSKNIIFELKTYKTTLKMKKFDDFFNGIMFFSPSGVLSFTSENNMGDSVAFCIGSTTAAAAQKFFKNVVVANATSVESVIAKTIKTLKEND